ncbi:MAG: DUF1150 family protein [Rhodospirillales bacterium]|nr:DUF1150 family protein [Rhodospirillales bacterium]
MKDHQNPSITPAARFLRSLSANDLASLGMEEMAYVKPTVMNGSVAYAIHAADGEQLALVPNRDVAFATVRHNDLDPLSVH